MLISSPSYPKPEPSQEMSQWASSGGRGMRPGFTGHLEYQAPSAVSLDKAA